jgi:hypothetical protein
LASEHARFARSDRAYDPPMAYVPDLDRLLAVDSHYQREDTTYVIEAHWPGNVTLPSMFGCPRQDSNLRHTV